MLTATVIGSVWATRRLAELPNGAFLEVEAEGTGQRLIAFDVLGAPTWWSATLVLAVGGITAVLGVLYALMDPRIRLTG